ncbi:MAG TPA: class I SAM-dependent methyltransferase [Solirubrobacteraceae bacterium]|nr:class I SAM-dependent methyltransferase [Solirubrobacteraceae bacterium]
MPGEPSFESMYVRAGTDFAAIPWAELAPNPRLVRWLKQMPAPTGERGLVVGCGLGDDAQELARRGLNVTAFDLSPTAIRRCRERFPDSPVDYRVADVFDPPGDWERAFDVIVEIRTLQSLEPGTREAAARSLAGLLAPGGRLLVVCFARETGRPVGTRPWPVSRAELSAFADAGLRELSFARETVGDAGRPTFEVTYTRSLSAGGAA